jgi:hypothetical protein
MCASPNARQQAAKSKRIEPMRDSFSGGRFHRAPDHQRPRPLTVVAAVCNQPLGLMRALMEATAALHQDADWSATAR